MKISLNEMEVGDFFEYRSSTNEEPSLYQKISPQTPNFNAILINQGELCNLSPTSKVFTPVTVSLTIERE